MAGGIKMASCPKCGAVTVRKKHIKIGTGVTKRKRILSCRRCGIIRDNTDNIKGEENDQ